MICLVDGNNFFVSCEQVFNPKLKNAKILVLSNNDGCVISRSNEAKAIGIKMGQPIFELKELIVKENIKIFSSNFLLYGDMSSRMMTIISEFSPDMEIYSIDEAFCDVSFIKK
jgi:DNA polymerase V